MLFEDGGQVGLGHVVLERAVAEDASYVARWVKFLPPLHYPEGKWLGLSGCNELVQTCNQYAASNGMDWLVRDYAGLDWDTQIKPQLEKQFVHQIGISPVGVDVI